MPEATSHTELEALWRSLLARVEGLGDLVFGDDAPESPRERIEGVRYLTRFLAAGLRVCIECDDPDYPVFGRMIENAMSWGLDNPDCNYSWARVRGDAGYRIAGRRGSARQLEFQVNSGHMGDGHVPAFSSGENAWRTISFLTGEDLRADPDGGFEVFLGGEERDANWLRLDSDASHVLVRQYFDDWEREEPGVFSIERVGAEYPGPALTAERLTRHVETLRTWLDAGAHCWDRMSRLLLGLEANTLLLYDVSNDVDRPGLHGQTYGMGPFACQPDEAVIVEFTPPPCRMWSIALTSFWWQSLEFGRRQTSLNGHQAVLDPDGVFRGVIAQEDPGVANWLDTEGHARGTLAVRFLHADATPKPSLHRVKRAELDRALPGDVIRITREERSARLARRNRALQRRYGY
jgi:hypothetical protein